MDFSSTYPCNPFSLIQVVFLIKKKKNYSESLQKDDDAFMVVGEGSEGEEGIKGFSSSDDDNSSGEFNNPSDIDNEVEKELQEEAAFEGVRCMLGEEGKECEVVNNEEEGQVLKQSSHNGSSLFQSCDEVGRFLNALNIKLISAEKEEGCNKKEEGPISKGARELRNLVFNVNYEKGLRGQGKICPQ